MAKPTNGIGWIPDNTSNCTDPDAKKTLGFIGSVDRVVANYINWLFNCISQWINWLDQSVDVIYYVNSTKSNSNDGRTPDTAFQTLDYALSVVVSLGSVTATIELKDHAGVFYITQDRVFYNSNIRILATDPDAVVVFNCSDVGGYNTLRKFTLVDTNLQISVKTLGLAAAVNGAEDWANFSSAIWFSGDSSANIRCSDTLLFNSTISATGGTRTLARNVWEEYLTGYPVGVGSLKVSAVTISYGTLDYLYDTLYTAGTISVDNITTPKRWILNGIDEANPDNTFTGIMMNTITTITSFKLYGRPSSATGYYVSDVISIADDAGTVASKISVFIHDAFPSIAIADVTGTIIKDITVTPTIRGLTITIGGDSKAVAICGEIIILHSSTIQNSMTIVQVPRRRAMNVLCNLPDYLYY